MRFIDKSSYFFLVIYWLIATFSYAQEVALATGINTDPPFVYGDFDISSEYPGITIEILKLIEKKTEVKFIIDKRPWARVVKDVKSSVLDGGFHFSFKEERKSFVSYPIKKGKELPDINYSISNRSYVLYRLKGSTAQWDGENIVHNSDRPVEVAVIRGGSITGDLKDRGHNLLEVGSDEQMLKLLLLGRVDVIVGLENMMDAKIQTLEPSQQKLIEKTYPDLVNKPYCIAFSKKFYQDHPQLAWEIWEVIKLIKSSGELAKVVQRYSDR